MARQYREIILHAGLPKTGTTSIQDNCFQQRAVLERGDLHYPEFKLGDRQLVNHSDPLTAVVLGTGNKRFWAYRQKVLNREAAARAEFVRQFEVLFESPSADRLLLSAELVASYDRKELKLLRRYLEKRTDRLRVVVFVRSPQSSLESTLQQQAYGGQLEEDLGGVIGAVTERLDRLQDGFGESLEILNYHDCIDQTGGLVGSFLRYLDIDEALLSGLEFRVRNQRVSMEAYNLMSAINQRYPVKVDAEGQYQRRFHDLEPLSRLPGAAFYIPDFRNTPWYEVTAREAARLEQRYGFSFPELDTREAEPLWQARTLDALEQAIIRLESAELREAAADQLLVEAQALGDASQTPVLEYIARRVKSLHHFPAQYMLELIGADYFKFAALQVEGESRYLPFYLMAIAQNLRDDSEQINERLKYYLARLDKD